LPIATKRAIEIRQFVERNDIDVAYCGKPCSMAPENDEQAKTFNVVREALAETKKAGLEKWPSAGASTWSH